MSGAPDTAAALAALWPRDEAGRTEVYAVLDGARDRRIEGLARLWGREPACLYGDGVGPDLRNAAPWLVGMERGSDEAHLLVERAWGNAWGVFAVAPAGTGTRRMARSLRRLLRVVDEEGSLILFRFYDPRVLRAFLPVLAPEQEDAMFGPVLRYVIEDEQSAPLPFARRV